ncbi:hypothetical protein D6D92_08760 [Moraxella catarrhalis]|uniref:hypothetical protein n=1 Tax=Moraxella catarrhalis TaxID=480 RepID=UPI000EAA4928|nr:hypothetical protein [Moraxella catarrhalis]RKM01707.1 hypothetical protein D6E05_08095 [Moraxella catarrhalis]RKM08245.1 hypothetical protein D6D89_01580 [Moraxella catarrhalis]RKM08561.1 hypothetical protein D6D84_02300 [Moraxella catarrhalis]RKM09752.1 hypothetical protein D6D97_08770 [Moraxella catarrhalis]RKM14670.1 hypothetical protein D6D61_08005 [Moraxella catarrhalis]
MKITLDQAELNQAVIDYLGNQGLTVDPSKVSIEITSEDVKIDTNKQTQSKKISVPYREKEPEKEKEKEPVAEPEKPSKPQKEESEPDTPKAKETSSKSLFGASDDILEDDTPTIPENQQVEKTRKLFQ